MRTLILTFFVLLAIPFSAGTAQADDARSVLPTLGITPGDARPLRQTGERTISSIDGTDIHLVDGQTIDLSGIWIPQSGGYEPSDQQVAAKQFLDKLFTDAGDRKILLYQTPTAGSGRITRLGHELAQVVRRNGNIWAQGALLVNGLAQAWPTPTNPELAGKMYALEAKARAAGIGLWAKDSPYRLVHAAEDIPNLDRFAVVEGTVKSIATVNNILYLNFGPDYKNDFTIGIASPVRRLLMRIGIDPMKLQGQRLRVRGWIRYYNGPYISLEDPVQLETLDQPMHDNIVPGIRELSVVPRKPPAPPVVHNAVEQGAEEPGGAANAP